MDIEKEIEEIVNDEVYYFSRCNIGKEVPKEYHDDIEYSYGTIVKKIISLKDRQAKEEIENIVKLSDKIESENETTLQEWKAFKRFRNTLRDKYLKN